MFRLILLYFPLEIPKNKPASIEMVFSNAPSEESLASVTGRGPVVLAGSAVPADGAVLRQRY